MVSSAVWFEIHVTDIERAIVFYRQLVGWQFTELDGMPADSYRQISNTPDGSTGGAIVGGFPERVGGAGTVIYLHVDDLGAAIKRGVAAGGSVETASQLINSADGQFALIRDPDANLLGLWSR